MGVVSFRISDDDEERLRRAGVNPGAEAKAHVEATARRLRAGQLLADLEGFSRRSPVPLDHLVRTIREEHG